MTRTYVSYKDEIKKLMKENEELKTKIALMPHAQFAITERQKAIIEFITNNPGKNKEDIIRKLTKDSKGSRNPIVKDIKLLEEEHHIIICKKDKSNSQFYRIYPNEESILLETYNNLNNFKKNFMETIDNLVQDESLKKDTEQNKFDMIITSLILIYVHTLNTYITYILLEWSNKFQNDTALLNKLFSLIFFDFVDINIKLLTSFQIPYIKPLSRNATYNEVKSPISQRFVYGQFLLKPHIILNILKDYQKNNLHSYIFPLLDASWKISYPVYEYIRIIRPLGNAIKWKPLKQISNINADLSLLLLHYIMEYCNDSNQNVIFPRFFEPSLILPVFDMSLDDDEEFYKTLLLEAIGREKYSEKSLKFLANEFNRFQEYLYGLNTNKKNFTECIKRDPNNKILEAKCLNYINLVENFLTIQQNNINNLLNNVHNPETTPKEVKGLNKFINLQSLTLESLTQYFKEVNKSAEIRKEISQAVSEIADVL